MLLENLHFSHGKSVYFIGKGGFLGGDSGIGHLPKLNGQRRSAFHALSIGKNPMGSPTILQPKGLPEP